MTRPLKSVPRDRVGLDPCGLPGRIKGYTYATICSSDPAGTLVFYVMSDLLRKPIEMGEVADHNQKLLRSLYVQMDNSYWKTKEPNVSDTTQTWAAKTKSLFLKLREVYKENDPNPNPYENNVIAEEQGTRDEPRVTKMTLLVCSIRPRFTAGCCCFILSDPERP